MSGFLSGALGSLGGLMEQHGGAGAAGGLLSSVFQDAGGVQGIVSKFEQAGMGDKAQSWVGGGGNLPLAAGELLRVFPPEQIESFAAAHGVPTEVATQVLQHLLPQAVDAHTPNGQLAGAGSGTAPGGDTANPFGGGDDGSAAGMGGSGGGGFNFGALAQRFLGGQ